VTDKCTFLMFFRSIQVWCRRNVVE
jgi:hypothetical protein